MKLLVSVVDADEVEPTIEGGADIVDIKNPKEGSLGAASFTMVERIITAVRSRRETSCAVGDMQYLPGTASLAAAGAASLSPNYVKLGLLGITNKAEALTFLEPVVEAIRSVNPRVNVISCAYGDWRLIGSISPLELPDPSAQAGADGVLIDTINKDGRSLFDFMSVAQVASFVAGARELGLITAIAGSLRVQHIDSIRSCDPDVLGIRGAACSGSDRKAHIDNSERIREFRARLP